VAEPPERPNLEPADNGEPAPGRKADNWLVQGSPSLDLSAKPASGGDPGPGPRANDWRPGRLPPPHEHIKVVAKLLLSTFLVSLGLMIVLAFLIAWKQNAALKDLLPFFSAVVATFGTLLGAVTGFYFTQRQ